ncbi:hypothetical protein SFUMM280S_07138 [Streptomyces fumanus]
MPEQRARRVSARTRRRLRATAAAVTAVAALTASQAHGPAQPERVRPAPAADDRPAPAPAAGAPYAAEAAPPPDDGSYHTELPPLVSPDVPAPSTPAARARAQAGIPGTVLRAYRAAERSVGRTDPGCGLPWELLAAIGKVESGQARGGAVDRDGTTLGRITGPALDGVHFALILDTDDGVHDGDTVYDRAVGPMQFLPSTWARWGADGNGDGRADPNNIFDAALAAGHYLCAGDRDLRRAADLDRAVLSYNNSRAYLDLVAPLAESSTAGACTRCPTARVPCPGPRGPAVPPRRRNLPTSTRGGTEVLAHDYVARRLGTHRADEEPEHGRG